MPRGADDDDDGLVLNIVATAPSPRPPTTKPPAAASVAGRAKGVKPKTAAQTGPATPSQQPKKRPAHHIDGATGSAKKGRTEAAGSDGEEARPAGGRSGGKVTSLFSGDGVADATAAAPATVAAVPAAAPSNVPVTTARFTDLCLSASMERLMHDRLQIDRPTAVQVLGASALLLP